MGCLRAPLSSRYQIPNYDLVCSKDRASQITGVGSTTGPSATLRICDIGVALVGARMNEHTCRPPQNLKITK